jgi:hypothetical protein
MVEECRVNKGLVQFMWQEKERARAKNEDPAKTLDD